MSEQPDMFLMTPQEEIDLAQSLPEGMELSPAAQALYEAQGAARFSKFHPTWKATPTLPLMAAIKGDASE